MISKDILPSLHIVINETPTLDVDHDTSQEFLIKLNSYRQDYRWIIPLGASIAFVGLTILIGTLVVFYTEPKKNNQICRMSFNRTKAQIPDRDSRPQHMSMGFINDDHYVDLVVANAGRDTVGIFINTESGIFDSQIELYIAQNCQPRSVALGYFNDDLELDIAAACYKSNNIAIFLAKSNASFQSPTFINLGQSKPLAIRTIHWNNDSKVDLAISTVGTALILVLLGQGDGSFIDGYSFHMGYDAYLEFLLVADVNSDNHDDIIVINNAINNLVILLGDGNGTAIKIEKWWQESGFIGSSVSIGDVNGDNRNDIVVGSRVSSDICIFFGSTSGTFEQMVITQVVAQGSNTSFIVLAQLDSDQIMDIVVVDKNNGTIVILKSNDDGTFSTRVSQKNRYSLNAMWILVDSLDQDSYPEIAIVDSETNNIVITTLYNAYIDGYSVEIPVRNLSTPTAIAAADFNGDNMVDIVVANAGQPTITVILQFPNTDFRMTADYTMYNDSTVQALTTGDINNDHYIDIVVTLSGKSAIAILFGIGDGSFRWPVYYNTEPNSLLNDIALNYLNQDNYLDIVVSDYYFDSVGVLLGRGNGTFYNMTRYSLPYYASPSSIAIGYIDRDSVLDIVTANYLTANVSILLGLSNGTFKQPYTIATDLYPRSIQIADMDDDSYPDIIFVNSNNDRFTIMFGDSNLSFSRFDTWYIESNSYPYALNVADYNRDGHKDVAIVNRYANNIMVYLGDRNQSFPVAITFYLPEGSSPSNLVTTHLNSDNHLDLLVNNYGDGTIIALLITNSVDLINQKIYSTGAAMHPINIKLAHMNNDTVLDIITANAGTNNIEVRSFNKESIYYSTGSGTRPVSITTGDFDRDTLQDIAVANAWTDDIQIFFGSKRPTATIQTGPYSTPTSITSGLINGDNRFDLIVANRDSDTIGIFLGWRCAQWDKQDIYLEDPSQKLMLVIAEDLNNDSYPDLIVVKHSSSVISIIHGSPYAIFTRGDILSVSYEPRFVIAADINNDHRVDLIMTILYSDSVHVFISDGSGSFSMENTFSTGCSNPKYLAVGDFNGDNKTDIVVSDGDYSQAAILLGFGNGSFAEPILPSIFDDSLYLLKNFIVTADFNRDGRTDIAVTIYDSKRVVIGITAMDGNVQNWTIHQLDESFTPYYSAIGDLNNDSFIDIAIVSAFTLDVLILFGDGYGHFPTNMTLSTAYSGTTGSIVVSDINNDHILDMLITFANEVEPGVYIYYGFGQGQFSPLQFYGTGAKTQPLFAAVADFNRDNQIDIVVANAAAGTLFLMTQTNWVPFTQQLNLRDADISKPIAVNAVDLNGDKRLDLVMINSGTNTIGVSLGHGDGTFDQVVLFQTNSSETNVTAMTVFDINSDNHMDLILVYTGRDSVAIWFGNGAGSWTTVQICSTGFASIPQAVTVVDWNNTRQYDIIVTNSGASDVLLLKFRNGSCVNPTSYSLDFDSDPRSIAVGDVNGDKLLDIVVASYGNNQVDVFTQTCVYDE